MLHVEVTGSLCKTFLNSPLDRCKTVYLYALFAEQWISVWFWLFLTDMKLHYGDLTDSMCLVKIISEARPTEIYNLAAQSHVKVSVWPQKNSKNPLLCLKNKLKIKIVFQILFSCEHLYLPTFSHLVLLVVIFHLMRWKEASAIIINKI